MYDGKKHHLERESHDFQSKMKVLLSNAAGLLARPTAEVTRPVSQASGESFSILSSLLAEELDMPVAIAQGLQSDDKVRCAAYGSPSAARAEVVRCGADYLLECLASFARWRARLHHATRE
jgi:hypothetical protein